jgi:hypothetical protein
MGGKETVPEDAEPLIQVLTEHAPVRLKKPL